MNRRTFVTGGAAATAATLATSTLAKPATACGPCEAAYREFHRRGAIIENLEGDCTDEQIAWFNEPVWEALKAPPVGDREWAALVLLSLDGWMSDAHSEIFAGMARGMLDGAGA